MARLPNEAPIQEHGVALLHALASRSSARDDIGTKALVIEREF